MLINMVRIKKLNFQINGTARYTRFFPDIYVFTYVHMYCIDYLNRLIDRVVQIRFFYPFENERN